MERNIELCKVLFLATLPSSLSISYTNLAHTYSDVGSLTRLALNIQNSWKAKSYVTRLVNHHNHSSAEFVSAPAVAHPSISSASGSTSIQGKRSFCFYCKRRDHLISDCPKRKAKKSTGSASSVLTAVVQTPAQLAISPSIEPVVTAVCYVANEVMAYPNPGQFTAVSVLLNGVEITAHLDSCSPVCILSDELALKLGLGSSPVQSGYCRFRLARHPKRS